MTARSSANRARLDVEASLVLRDYAAGACMVSTTEKPVQLKTATATWSHGKLMTPALVVNVIVTFAKLDRGQTYELILLTDDDPGLAHNPFEIARVPITAPGPLVVEVPASNIERIPTSSGRRWCAVRAELNGAGAALFYGAAIAG